MSEHIFIDEQGQTTFTRIRNIAEAGTPMPKEFAKKHNTKLSICRLWSWRIGFIASVCIYLYLIINLFKWLRLP